MTKRTKIVMIVLGCVAALLVALIVLAKVLITPERVRATVIPLAEEALDRKVELGAIDVSLFSGISLNDLAVREKGGDGDFVAADKVVLRYSLLALLMLRVEVDEIALVRPRIAIVRSPDGSFNFSDLVGSDNTASPAESSPSSATATPIALHVSKISIVDGAVHYNDLSVKGNPQRHEVSAFNLAASDVSLARKFPLEVSAVWNGNTLGLKGDVDLPQTAAAVEVVFNRIKAEVAGGMTGDKIVASVNLPKTTFADLIGSVPKEYAPDLSGIPLEGNLAFGLKMDGDVVKTNGFAVEINGQKITADLVASRLFDKIVKVDVKVGSDALELDRLIPPASDSGKSASAPPATGTQEEIGPFDIPVELTGEVRVGKMVFNQIPIQDLTLTMTLRKNIFQVENLSAMFADGKVHKTAKVDLGVKGLSYTAEVDLKGVEGGALVRMLKPGLSGSLEGVLGGEMKISGAGTVPDTMKKKLTGNGVFQLANGKLQSIPALDSIAALLGVNELRQIVLDDGKVNFTIKDGQVIVDSRIEGPKTRATTAGQVGLDGRLDLRSSLALSPELGGRLREQGSLSRYLGDEQGWTTVPLRIKGAYDSPDVGLDSREMKKQAETAVKKEVQKSLEKELGKGLKKLFGN